ncbi:MAG: DAK2 domain-containing protein [Actinomycetota bacterium]|jgi:DAK2 domain fusion protein YloV|nr:DAK2 domain-containing protein [Actinomycetota bacterium]
MTKEAMSSADLGEAVRAYGRALTEYRAALNRLNVYPVPDGDTGTNMALTVEAVLGELDQASAMGAGEEPQLDMERLAEALSHGSLMGARGNSGVILSQVMRGLASVVRQHGAGLEPAHLGEAFRRAAESAYAAVSNPVEGTILTVARAAAEGAARALEESPGSAGRPRLMEVLESAREAAARALAGTTEQLPALEAAGVVDAGGAGLLLLYDSLLHVLDGRAVPAPPVPSGRAGRGRASVAAPRYGEGVEDLRYEVMFFLEAPDEAIPGFREVWAGCGGSVVIVGGDGLYNCHIHTDDIGACIEAAIEIGRPRQIRVTDLAEQVEEERWVRDARASGDQYEPAEEAVTTAVVAVCAGEGVKRIFRSLGVHHFVAGGQSANPSVAELLEAIGAAAAEQVVVLPNNPNVVPVAEQAAANSAKKVRVVPTGGMAEGFAALLDYDPEADVDTNAEAMAGAAARVVPGEVAQASRDALTAMGQVYKGDWLGLSREEVMAVAPAPATAADAAIALLETLVTEASDYEIVTLIEGEGATPAGTRRVVEWLAEHRPGITAEVHHGGQPIYTYVLSVE